MLVSDDGKRLAYMELGGRAANLDGGDRRPEWTVKGGPAGAFSQKPNPPKFFPLFPRMAAGSHINPTSRARVRSTCGPFRRLPGKAASGRSPTPAASLRPGRADELIYQSGDQLMAASYTVQGDSFVNDKPRVWLD